LRASAKRETGSNFKRLWTLSLKRKSTDPLFGFHRSEASVVFEFCSLVLPGGKQKNLQNFNITKMTVKRSQRVLTCNFQIYHSDT